MRAQWSWSNEENVVAYLVGVNVWVRIFGAKTDTILTFRVKDAQAKQLTSVSLKLVVTGRLLSPSSYDTLRVSTTELFRADEELEHALTWDSRVN